VSTPLWAKWTTGFFGQVNSRLSTCKRQSLSGGTGGCAIRCFVPTFSEIFEEGFLSGGSAMRCRIPFSSATDEMVLKQNTDPGWRAILHWEVTAIELAWINDTPPTWRASYRCLEPDRTPGVTPHGAFG
jgi:hypothetical protein